MPTPTIHACRWRSLVDRVLFLKSLMLRDQFGADDLEREGYRRTEHQQGVDRGGVSETRGAEHAGDHDVVEQVHDAHQAGAGK